MLHVDDLHLYLKCHSSAGVFQTFFWKKPTTWFSHKWNIAWKWFKLLNVEPFKENVPKGKYNANVIIQTHDWENVFVAK